MSNGLSPTAMRLRQIAAHEKMLWSAVSEMEVLKMGKKAKHHVEPVPEGSAAIVVVEREGLVLAVSRKHDHADLGLPGGKIEPGEDPITTVCREAVEETGGTLCNPILVKVAKIGDIKVFIYQADIFGDLEQHVNSEGALVSWVDVKHICRGTFGKFNQEFIEPIVNNIYTK